MAKKTTETRIGNIYESKRHPGVVGMVFMEDTDRKTVGLRTKDGKEVPLTLSTLQRWWKLVPEDKAQYTPDTPVDNTPVQDTPKQAKTPVNKEVKTQDNPIRDYVFAQVEKLGGTIFVPDTSKKNYNFRTFKVDGKMFAYFTFAKKKCVLRVRGEATQVKPDKTVNHMFNNAYDFTELTTDTKKVINTILKDAYTHQVNKNSNKAKKGEK